MSNVKSVILLEKSFYFSMRELLLLLLIVTLVSADRSVYILLNSESNECSSDSIGYLSGIYSDVFSNQNDISLIFKCSNESFSPTNDVVIYTRSVSFVNSPIDTTSNNVFIMDEYSGCLPNVYSTGNPTFLYEIGMIIIFMLYLYLYSY